MIENNILALSNAMFRNKTWGDVKDEQKEQFFFIFNRYFSVATAPIAYIRWTTS